ncbi:hypothetical protein OXIME_001208 [Oxyplasma meridianum]|uniref:Uncharacterized protein n=1 Tax=Oxyplasma meridianum TaxID=3073602 RepID=A0AAX4NH07_9ARCH
MMSYFIKRIDSIFYQQSFEAVNEFFSGFSSQTEMVEWMRKRKRQDPVISEVDGKDDIIAVIAGNNPAEMMGTDTKKDLFSEFRKIYSGTCIRIPDYSLCINESIKRALKYDPEWIAISSPNTHVYGKSRDLMRAVKLAHNEENRILIPNPSPLRSRYIRIGKRNFLSGKININRLEKWAYGIEEKLSGKFGDIYIAEPMDILHRAVYRWIFSAANTSSFIVLSADWLKSMGGHVMDETFTSAYCEVDFSIRHTGKAGSVNFINLPYRSRKRKASGLSLPFEHAWDLCNRIYMTHKINNSYY